MPRGVKHGPPVPRELEFHPFTERQTAPDVLIGHLEAFRAVLDERGMADMEEYGDMLQWALPKGDGVWRKFHAYHPDWCSWDDRFRGTIHYHAGRIQGTLLAGSFEHYTYEAERHPDGDRFHGGEAYRLTRHTRAQTQGITYELPAMVPHWIKPTALTITYFEEQETDDMADLVEPATEEIDDHKWTQADAEALLPKLHALIDERIAELRRLSPITA